MASSIDLTISSKYNSAGAKSALADIAAIKAALAGLKGAGGGGGSASPTNIPPIPPQTRQSVLAFAQAQAAAQKATGDTAGAVKTMQAAVAGLAPGTIAANRAIVGLASAEKALASEQTSVAASLAKTEKATISEAQAMARLQAAQGNAAGAMHTLSTAIDKVGASSTTTLGAQTQLANLGGKSAGMFSELGSTALKAAAGLATIAIALGGLNSAAQALKMVGDYEQELNILQATSGATAGQMRAVGDEAKALGADLSLPATSAAGAAHAMTELVKDGLSLYQAMAAAKGTLQLAAAGMISEGEAAQNTATALNAFALSGKEATTVADVFAAATSKGVRVQDMGEAIKNAGAAFAQYQSSAVGAKGALIELATATALMAQSGIAGAEAGTSLKVMLTFLAAPTRTGRNELTNLGIAIGQTGNIAYDAQGKMKPLPLIMRDIARATVGMTEAQKNVTLKNIFGTDAGRAAYVLLQSQSQAAIAAGKGWDAMAAAIQRANAAQDLAGARMQGLNGAVEGLQSQVETLALNALEPLLPIITSIVSEMAVFVGSLSEGAGPAMTGLITDVAQIAATIQSLVIPALAAATTATLLYAGANSGALVAAIAKTTTALIANAGAWLTANGAMLAGAGAIAVAAVAVGAAVKTYQNFNQQITEGASGVLESTKWYHESTTALKNYSDAHVEGNANLKGMADAVQGTRGQLQAEVEQLAKSMTAQRAFGVASGVTAENLAHQQRVIDQHKKALESETASLEKMTQKQLAANSALATAPAQLLAEARHEVALDIVPRIDDKERGKLEKQVHELGQNMGKVLTDSVNTATTFTEKIADSETKHNDTILKLQKEMNAAKTSEARKGVEERIAAEQAGYSKEIGAQAAAYAQERAAQRAHIGEMLIEWTQAQQLLDPKKFTPQVAEQMIGGIKDAFGVLDDKGAEAIAHTEAGLLGLAESGNVTADSIRGIANETDSMVAKQATINAAFDKVIAPREAEVTIKMKGKSLEEISAELDKVRRVTYAEVQITQKGDPHDIADAIMAIPPERQSEIAVTLSKADPKTIQSVLEELPPSVATTLAISLVGQDPVALKNQIASIPDSHRTAALLEWARNDPQKLAAEIMAMPDSHLTTAIIQMGGIAISSILSQLSAIPRQVVSTIITQHLDVSVGGSPNEGRAHAAGGGSFVTNGPTHFTVGDNPGGRELVHVTPLSGTGTTTTSGSVIRMAGGGTAVVNSGAQMNVSGNIHVDVGPTDPGTATDQAGRQAQASADAVTAVATKAGAKLESIAVATGNRLAAIDEKSAQKILDIEEKTAQQLADFDQKAADDRAKANQELNNQMVLDNADMRAKMEADDIDFFKKGANVKDLQAREKEEQRVIAETAKANEEARKNATTVDAQYAKDVLSIRKQQTQESIALDKSYNEAQANTKKKQKGDLKKQYDEAVAAQKESEQTQLVIAKAAADERAKTQANQRTAIVQSGEDEKAKVIADATEQNAQVTAKAAEQADKVGASADAQKSRVIAAAQAQKDRSVALARQQAAETNAAMDSIHGPPSTAPSSAPATAPATASAAGGGSFVTSGKTTFTVGDNPGGVEMVHVTPLSGRGTSSSSGNVIRMAGGGTAVVNGGASTSSASSSSNDAVHAVDDANQIIAAILPYIHVPNNIFHAVEIYMKELRFVADMLSAASDIRSIASTTIFPIRPETIKALGTDTNIILETLINTINPELIGMANATKKYGEFVKAATEILTQVTDLREKIAKPHLPIDPKLIIDLAHEAVLATTTIEANLLPTEKHQSDALTRYTEAVKTSIDLVTSMADLRDKLATPHPPLDIAYIKALASESLKVGAAIGGVMVPIAEGDVEKVKTYADAVATSIGVLTGMADLRDKLTKPHPPLDLAYIKILAAESLKVGAAIGGVMVPISDENLKTLTSYADAVGKAVGILTSVQDLADKLSTPKPAINLAYVQQLAKESLQVGGIVGAVMVPIAEKDLQALTTYAATVGQAIGVLTNVQDLREKLAKPQSAIRMDYISQLAVESQQVAVTLANTVVGFSQDQVDALKRYQESVGAAVGVLADVQDIRDKLTKPAAAIDPSYVQALANDSQAVAVILNNAVVGFSQEQVDALKRYQDSVGAAVAVLANIQDIADRMSKPAAPIDASYVQTLANESQTVAVILANAVVGFSQEQVDALKRYQESVGAAVAVLSSVQDIAEKASKPAAAIDSAYVQRLADESQLVSVILNNAVVRFTQDEVDGLKRYQDSVGAAVSVLANVQDLAEKVSTPQPVIDPAYIQQLADASQTVSVILNNAVVRFTQDEVDGLKRYQDSVGAAVATLNSVQDLAKNTTTQQAAIDPTYIQSLADQSQQIATIVYQSLIPYTTDEAAALKTYADTVGSAVSILNGVISLNNAGKDLAPLISDAQIATLATQANHITDLVLNNLLSVTDDEAAALKRYAEAEGAATTVLKDALSLSGKLFADYISPTDAQIALITKDADRVIRAMTTAAKAYSTDGLTAAKAYADATNSTFQAYKEGLLFFQALNSGDFNLDDAKLQLFEASMAKTISVADRLAAQAATIPASNLNALQAVTSALTAEYESLIKLSAVPDDALAKAQEMIAAVAGSGGSAAATTQYITNYTTNNQYTTNTTNTTQNVTVGPGAIVVQGAGMSADVIANQVIQQLQQKVTARR
jgi:hypothetical protein